MAKYSVGGVQVVKDDGTIDWANIKGAPEWVAGTAAGSAYTGSPTVRSDNVGLADVSATLQFSTGTSYLLQANVNWGSTDTGYPVNCQNCG